MHNHLLIAIDGSDIAFEALKEGVGLAKKLGARITIVTVTEPWQSVMVGGTGVGFPLDDYDKANMEWASKTLSEGKTIAEEAGLKAETVHVKDSYPADGIIATAEQRDCDLIVMASHGRRGFSRLLLGSQANEIVTHSTVPVLIWRQKSQSD
jgi:nucleotide-binding universal stress UspA family protein